MKIDKTKLKVGIWYEDKDGNYIPSSESVDAPEEAVTCHTCFPLQIRTEHFYIKPHTDPDGITHRTYHGDDRFLTTSCLIGGGNEAVILAMANSGDYTLSEALAVYANACERCSNVLAYKYLNGTDGYPEYSEEWKKCGTVCEYCAGMGYSDRVRGHRIENTLTDLPLVLPGAVLTESEYEFLTTMSDKEDEK